MPKCIFPSCPHFMGKNCFSPGITLHVFPKDLARIKLWLQQTGQYCDDIDDFAEKILSSKMGSYRMCSAHFVPKSYMTQGTKVVLKPDAVPTVFPGNVVEVAIKHVPQKKKQRLEEKEAGKKERWSQVDAGTSTIHILQTEMGTQTDMTTVTIQSCSVSVPRWNTYDRGIQWPEYEFNFYGEDWKVQLDHMYFNSRFKCVQELPNVEQEEIMKDHYQVPSTLQHGSSPEDHRVAQQEPLKQESEPHTSPETPEGCFFSKCSLRNKKTLCILQAKLVALLRHMTEAPHMGSYKRQRTRKLLSQIVELVCLVAGEDLKLVKKNEDLSKFYQKEGQIPVRYQDVAVFFTREEWNYIEENEELYKKEILSDPNESKEDQIEDFIDDLEEDADITDDHFFKLLEVNSQGHSPGAAPVGRKRKKVLLPTMPCISENVPRGEQGQEDWPNNRTCKSEYLSDNEDAEEEDGGCLRSPDPEIANEETVSASHDLKPLIKREECSPEIANEETASASHDLKPLIKREECSPGRLRCPTSDNMASPGQKYDDVISKSLEGFDPPPLDRESSQEDGAVVTPEIPAAEQTQQTPEAAGPGKPVDGNLSTSNIPAQYESGTVSFLPPGFGILVPSTKRSNRRKSKPKKLVVPEEEDGGSPWDGVEAADGSQNSGTTHDDGSVPSKSRRARKTKPVKNFQKPYLSWKTGDMPSLMFVVPNEEMESIENKNKKKKRKQQEEEESQEMHWCDICDDCFPSLGDLETHQATHIEEEPKEDFDCEECGRVFDSDAGLQAHQSKSHGKLRYCCDICGIQYNYQSQYFVHMRAHSGEKLFTCDECGKEFKHRCSLVIHQRRHVGVTPHQCQKCGKMLDTRSELAKHEKMRYCPDCNKCYTQRGFNKHLVNNCVKP
ncbi:zinc finger protein 37-like isoform X3 [Rana temporaria]|uniref:zinc finger protein 37-like isoform X3 n=1 Tax=Rana temporaria TaxID=8407 RepID=UPI001AACDE02|nr:zinc finger protein 37-like isoform X3 [Rana temporaria]